ncbi:uncharacterized protein dtex3lb.1 [Garra rufa]|uniref:uncharacterized protein dtex3lb.1 n=1 Tax=Garra rufa TaxID=137080 RepID=UPI003CCE666F
MDIDEYDLYTAGPEGQAAGPSLDDMMHLNSRMNRAHLQPEEDIYTACDEMIQPSAPLDIAKFKIKVNWTEQFPERWQVKLHKALQSWLSRLEGTVSVHSIKLMEDPSCAEVQIIPSTAIDVLKNHTITSLKFKDIQFNRNKEVAAQIYLDETNSVTVPQKSMLEENRALSSKVIDRSPPIGTFKIKVDWKEPFPDKWGMRLQMALQSWLSKLERTAIVQSIKLMEDPSCAEVWIIPSTALEVLKRHTTTHLKFKDRQEVAAWIFLDETHSATVPQKSLLEENRALSSKMNSSMPGTSAEANQLKDETAEMTPETSATFTLPFHLSLYILHAYRKELEQIQNEHGVSCFAEVSISFKPTQNSSSHSVSKASVDFQNLVQKSVDSFSDATINHNDMDLDIVKESLHAIQSDKEKMMFTMSASNCTFFGPKKCIDVIKRETTRHERQLSPVDVDNSFSPKSKSFLDIDTKDLPTQLEMDKVYWDLMKLSYEEQLSRLETKYGVSFYEEKQHNNLTIKVQAQSKVGQLINLESHALTALTQLYQKLASAAVSCELKNPTDKAAVATLVEKLQQKHYGVVAADVFSPWTLVGLPEHLSPAIAEIEKTLKKNVFDDKMKKLIGYSGDITHARKME